MNKTNEQRAMQASITTIIGDVFLVAFKLVAGIVGHSAAMLADAIHSLSDMVTTIVVMVGVKMANRAEDKDHPYGHERFESVATIILSLVLLATGAGIGWAGVQQVMNWDSYATPTIPGIIGLVAAVTTIVVKEGMYWYKRRVAKQIDSSALMADAWHHRTDSLSSVGSFAGILLARSGFPIFDPLAAILISLFIIKAAFDVFRDAMGKMTDKSADEETEHAMREIILAHEPVLEIDLLKTRIFGDKIYMDLEIQLDGNITLREAHETGEAVHDALEAEFAKLKHCMVHINPTN